MRLIALAPAILLLAVGGCGSESRPVASTTRAGQSSAEPAKSSVGHRPGTVDASPHEANRGPTGSGTTGVRPSAPPEAIIFSAHSRLVYRSVLGVDPEAYQPVTAGGPPVSLTARLPAQCLVESTVADAHGTFSLRTRLTWKTPSTLIADQLVATGVSRDPREVHLTDGRWDITGPALSAQAKDTLLNLVRDAVLLKGVLGEGSVQVGDERVLAGETFRCVRTTAGEAYLASVSEYGWPAADAKRYPSAPGVVHHLRIQNDPAGGLRGLERSLGVCDADGTTIQLRRTRFDFSQTGTP